MTIKCNAQNSFNIKLDNYLKERRDREKIIMETNDELSRKWDANLKKSNQQPQNFRKIVEKRNLMIENDIRNFKMSNSPISVQNDFIDHSFTTNEIFSTKEMKKAEIEEKNEKVKEPEKRTFIYQLI